ncbi:hypothetical protein ACLBKU_10960 [Erythrobacter sp. NE805]|uniref:hypothetical protein n=1 Tax=Erythrobacter sp. NE805 TaxID=3389875 RepID=UPI00396B1F4E
MFTPPPADPHKRPDLGPAPARDPEERAFLAAWLAHVEAGRIGTKLETPEHIRAATLANKRLVRGQRPLSER